MGPTVRGDAGLPRSRRPTTLAGATSPGPAFLPERHRNPGYVVPPQPARAGYSGPGPSRVARHPALHPPPPPASQVPPTPPRRRPRTGWSPAWGIPEALSPRTGSPRPPDSAPCPPAYLCGGARCPSRLRLLLDSVGSPALSPRQSHSEPRAARTAPPPSRLAAGVTNRRPEPTTWRHWRRCL